MSELGIGEERVLDMRDHESALAFLRSRVQDTESRAQARALLADESASAALCEFEEDEILDALAWRICRADLTPTAHPRVYRSADLVVMPQPSDDEPVLAAAKETTWIEIQLVDEVGEPVEGEPYELTLPNGSMQRGKLNYRGRARVDNIDEPGQCLVTFPDLDRDVWERA
jgi:hypothetical protein